MLLINILANFVGAIVRIYEFLLVARAICSWLPVDLSNPIVNFLYSVTEPVLAPIRNLLFKIPFFRSCPIDFSMIVLFMIFEIVQSFFYF